MIAVHMHFFRDLYEMSASWCSVRDAKTRGNELGETSVSDGIPKKPTDKIDIRSAARSVRLISRAQEVCESRGGRPGLPRP